VDVHRGVAGGLRGTLQRILREKRWTYVLLAGDQAMAGVAVVQAGWFGGAFLWALDRATGALLVDRSAAALPGLGAVVRRRPLDGARATFRGPGLRLRVDRVPGGWRIDAASGRAFRLEALLHVRGAPAPFTLIAPTDGGGFRATTKVAALRAAGRIEAGGRVFSLEGSGGLDTTIGVLARRTEWRWAFGTGRLASGVPVAFNLAEGFGGVPAGDPGENALFLGPGPGRLPAVTFRRDPAAPLAPWRIASADGALDLVFRGRALHREARSLGVLRTSFVQVAGEFTGMLPVPGGAVRLDALPGVVEDHRAVW